MIIFVNSLTYFCSKYYSYFMFLKLGRQLQNTKGGYSRNLAILNVQSADYLLMKPHIRLSSIHHTWLTINVENSLWVRDPDSDERYLLNQAQYHNGICIGEKIATIKTGFNAIILHYFLNFSLQCKKILIGSCYVRHF